MRLMRPTLLRVLGYLVVGFVCLALLRAWRAPTERADRWDMAVTTHLHAKHRVEARIREQVRVRTRLIRVADTLHDTVRVAMAELVRDTTASDRLGHCMVAAASCLREVAALRAALEADSTALAESERARAQADALLARRPRRCPQILGVVPRPDVTLGYGVTFAGGALHHGPQLGATVSVSCLF
jgi:hypothetical protein